MYSWCKSLNVTFKRTYVCNNFMFVGFIYKKSKKNVQKIESYDELIIILIRNLNLDIESFWISFLLVGL